MRKHSFIEQLILLVIILIPVTIGSIIKAKRDAKENERIKKREEEMKQKENQYATDENGKKIPVDLQEVTDWLNKEYLRKLLTPEYKKHIRELLDKAFKDGLLDDSYDDYYNTNKIPEIKAEYDGDNYIIIIDDEQMVRVALSDIIEDVAKVVREHFHCTCSTGDGDEGCIYPEYVLK